MGRKRKNYLSDARERYPDAAWIIGGGPYASVAQCPSDTTVMLFRTPMEATQAKAYIDRHGCGGKHQIVDLRVGTQEQE